MAIGVMDFPLLTPQQTNPASGTLADMVAKRLAIAKMQGEEKKAPYAGLAEMAKIRSQNAYSNAVMPQFQAKLLENKNILPNIKDPQQRANALLALGVNMQGNNNLTNSVDSQLASIYSGQQNSGSLLDNLTQHIGSMFGNAPPPQSQMGQQISQVQQGMPQGMPQGIPQPQQQPQMQPPQQMPPQMPQQAPVQGGDGSAGGYGRTPENVQFGQNIQDFNRQTERGTSLGKKEGEQLAEYGESAANVIDQEKSAKYLSHIFQDPTLQQISDVPFASQKSIGFYKQSGTPEQKRKLGEMEAAMNSYVTASAKVFGSRATDTDVRFIKDDLKPSERDTMDVRRGKMVALETMVGGKKAQILLANGLMKQGYSKADAENIANNQIDMNAIRDKAYNQAFPPNVKIQTPRGIIELPPRGAEQLLRDHPEMHQVVG